MYPLSIGVLMMFIGEIPMHKLLEVKLLVNKSEQVGASEQELQTNVAQKTPTKLVNMKNLLLLL